MRLGQSGEFHVFRRTLFIVREFLLSAKRRGVSDAA